MISIIIPTYNEEKVIETTVRQFDGLTIPHEVIVSDSKSSDRTVAIAKRCADKVVGLPPGAKRCIAQGRNDGAAVAAGEYMAFLDADVTIPNPNIFFTKALMAFAHDPRLVAITAQVKVHRHLSKWGDKIVYSVLNPYFAFFNNVLNFGMSAGEFHMVKTSAFKEVGGNNVKLVAAEDMDLFHRLAKKGRVRTVWALIVFHPGRRLHQEGWVRTVYRWIRNALSVWFLKKSADKEWEPVR
jgi:glycosyltransferase involved in cell wall biosynthesis